MADKQVNIVLKATDQTKAAIQSASSGLASLGKVAAGFSLGQFMTRGLDAAVKGIFGATIGMNQSMDATKRSAVSMLESIRNSSGSTAESFAGTARQVSNWGRQLREIREREQEGTARFADQTRRLNEELENLLAGGNIRRRARDEEQAIADLTASHQEKIADLQQDLEDAQREGLVVDGVLYAQGNEKRIRALQERIDKENAAFERQKARRAREYDEDIAELRASNDRRIAEVRRSLEEQRGEERRFVRDIKEAYADLQQAKADAAAGSGAGGLAEGSQAVITYREELQKLSKTSAQVFAEFQDFFRAEGIRSPFSIEDIQRAGAQMIQFSGGSLKNMQGIVRMAEALASSPAVNGFSGAERMDLAIRALTEAYNGQFTSIQRIFNVSGSAFEALKNGTFTTTEFTEELNRSLEQAGINYDLVAQRNMTLEGAWDNLIETGRSLLGTLSSPVYQWLTDRLIDINTWAGNNQQTLNRWADDLRDRVASVISNEVQPRLDDFLKWLQSDQAKKDMAIWSANFQQIARDLGSIVSMGGQVASKWREIGEAGKQIGDALNIINSLAAAGGGEVRNFLGNATGYNLIRGLVGRRATGGPVTAGRPYIVGEREPELFVPRQSGTILNGSQMSQATGGNTYTFNHYGDIRSDVDIHSAFREMGFRVTR